MKSVLASGVAAAVAVLFSWAAQGQASQVTVQLGGPDIPAVSCTDGAACDSNPLAGVVTFTAANGALTVSIGGTGSGAPALAGFNMDLSYNLVATASDLGGKTYTIAVSQKDLNGSASWTALVDGNQTNGATTAFSAFADAGNVLFTNGAALCGAGPVSTGSVHLSCTSGVFSDSSFSLTELVTIHTLVGSTSVSGNALLSSVPEPATLLLVGSALVGAGILRRRLGRAGA